MDLQTIRYKLDAITLERGAASRRDYISMSQIGECPRVLYDQLVAPDKARPTGKERLFALDKELKAGVRERLHSAGLLSIFSTREILAEFDGAPEPRLRGHLDGEFTDGVLLHVKPCLFDVLQGIRESDAHRIPRRHYEQIQMYMRHADYERGRIVYVARENGDIWLSEIRADERAQDRLDEKALGILDAFDHQERPACACGRCDQPVETRTPSSNATPRGDLRIFSDDRAPTPTPATRIDPRAWDKFKFTRHK